MIYLYSIIFIFVISEIIALAIHDFYIYPICIVLFDFICYAAGNYYLDDVNSCIKYLSAYILFFIGYCIAHYINKNKNANKKKNADMVKVPGRVPERVTDRVMDKVTGRVPDRKYDNTVIFRSIVLFTVIVTAASYYHIIKVGIPLFSSNIEISRFDFTGSGFFGIPGRIYLFGYPFLIPYIYYHYNYSHDKRIKVLLRLVWVLYIILSVLGGFKSSISALIIYYINIKALTGRPVRIRKFFTVKYIAAFTGAILFAIGISKIYKSVNVNSTEDAINYLFTRLFSFGALGGNILLNRLIAFPAGKIIINDSIYFAQKYFHINFVDYNIIAMSKYVSAYNLHITNISDDTFISPYTLGAFPELYFDFGYLSYLLIALIGYLYSYLSLKKTSSFFTQASICFSIVFLLNSYITKGSLIYCLLNFIMMIIFFKFLEISSKMFAR